MSAPLPVVFVVDDEEPVGDSIAMLLRAVGLRSQVYRDPRQFLEDYRPEQPGCFLLLGLGRLSRSDGFRIRLTG